MRTRRLAAVASVSLAALPFLPSHAVASFSNVDTIAEEGTGPRAAVCVVAGAPAGGPVALKWSGEAPGAVAVRVGCGVVQNGRVVAYGTNAMAGSAAAGAKTAVVGPGTYRACVDLYVLWVDGAETRHTRCP